MVTCIKRLLHDIFHIGPGISPRLPYQARQRRWRVDMGRGLIPGIIWKISCNNLFITYFTVSNVIVQINIVWYIFETIFETNIFASWTMATLLKIYFRNLSVHRSFLQYRNQCLEKVNVKYVIKRLWHEIFHIIKRVAIVQLANIFVSNMVSKIYQTMLICTMTLETVCKIYPRRWHLNGNSYSARRIYLS
jgi:hypothetical protein